MEIGMISLRELEYRLDRNMAMQLIDLRAPADYQKFHIEGAVNLPYSQLKERLLELQPAPPLIFYCARGGTSLQAARMAVEQGIFASSVMSGIAHYRGRHMIRN